MPIVTVDELWPIDIGTLLFTVPIEIPLTVFVVSIDIFSVPETTKDPWGLLVPTPRLPSIIIPLIGAELVPA